MDYVITCPNPRAVQDVVDLAKQLLAKVVEKLHHCAPQVHDDDPRLITSVHQAMIDIFKVEPGLPSLREVHQIRVNSEQLLQAVRSMKPPQCVAAGHPDCGKEWHHVAFAVRGTDRTPTISLCPGFFSTTTTKDERALTIIHELAHARLNVGHRGGEFVSYDPEGSSTLNSFDDAIENAYSYENFARRIS
jgi:hypothetical protein